MGADTVVRRAKTWRALLLGAALAGATVAAASPAPAPAGLLETLRVAYEAAHARLAQEDWAGCIAALQPLETRALAHAADDRVAWSLLILQGCRTAELAHQPGPRDALTQQAREQWHTARQHRMAPRYRMWQVMSAWDWIDRQDGAAAADAWLETEVLGPLLPPAQAGSAEAHDELLHAIEAIYGRGDKLGRIEALQRRLAGALDADAPVVLGVTRLLAVKHRRAARPDQALAAIEPAYQRALRAHPGSDLLAWLDSERALVLGGLGRVQEALDGQLRVAAHWARRQPADHWRGARAEQNLAQLQLSIGRLDAVAEHARRAEAWAADAGPLRSQIQAENIGARIALAVSRLRQGQPGALAALRDTLQVHQPDDFFLWRAPLEELWLGAEQQGDAELTGWARSSLQAHLDRWIAPLQTDALLGELLRARREPAQADAARWQAVALGSMGRGPALEALALFETADAQAARAPALAVALYKRAGLALQRAHADTPSAELLRVSFARFEAPLRRFVALLLDQGRLAEADQALAFLHEGELDALQRRQAALSGPPALAAGEQAWNREVERIGRELLQTAQALTPALDAQPPLHYPGHVRLPQASAAQADAGAALARAAALVTAPVAAGPADEQPAPAAGTASLGFVVGAQQLDVLLRLPAGPTQHLRLRLPLPRAELARRIQRLRQLLERPDSDLAALQREARALHARLLAPVLARLPAGVRRLQLRSDGVLHYLPFAALHDGRRYLAERYVLSQRGPAARTPAAANTGAPLGLGRVRGDGAAAALPAVGRELQPLRQWPGSQLALDAGFSAAALQAGLARQPALVHVATHFHLDPGGDGASYLLLGDDSRLSVDQLAQLPWQGVRLALLSGCQTGLAVDGQARPGGLAARLRLAGVEQVLATQWRVADSAAADWVGAFYAGLPAQDLARHRPEPGWLARAQQQWLHTHRHSPRAHPHYWAAYAWFE